MTLQEWYKDEGNLTRLSLLLGDPVLSKALSVVEDGNRPIFRPGVGPSDLALVHSFQSGVHHVRRALEFLTRPQVSGSDLPDPWTGPHIIKPEVSA